MPHGRAPAAEPRWPRSVPHASGRARASRAQQLEGCNSGPLLEVIRKPGKLSKYYFIHTKSLRRPCHPRPPLTGQWLLLRFSTVLLRNPKGQSPYGLGSGHRRPLVVRRNLPATTLSTLFTLLQAGKTDETGARGLPSGRAQLFTPMQLPQDGWPVPKITAQSSSSSISAASDTGSDRTSSSSRTSSPQRKRNSESRDDADEGPPCEHTAASSLLMLFEEEGKPAIAPMPFFQFPRIAPAALSSAPLVKRPCISFGTKAPSATMGWPQRTDLSRGDASRADCSPRVAHSRAPPSSLEIQEAMSKMVQDRLSSGSASSE